MPRHFQRAESACFFQREIGLLYLHAQLHYAQALAHAGEAERFLRPQPKEVAALHDPVPGSYRVDRALDVVQIDHARVDVVVVARPSDVHRPALADAGDRRGHPGS